MKKRILAVILVILVLAAAVPAALHISAAESNEQTVYRYLTETMHLNTAAACGIMANLQKESGFNPHCSFTESGGFVSYGLCQWNRERRTALENYCAKHGYDYTTLIGQLHYMQYELETGESYAYSKVRNVPDTPAGAYEAGYNWARYFERCSEWYQGVHQYSQRAELAQYTYWPKYHTHSYTSSVTSEPGCEAAGVRTYACTCGSTYTEQIAPIGHDYALQTQQPTCTDVGYDVYTCSHCGSFYTEQIAPIGHDYTVQTQQPTCTDAGYDLHTCSRCGDSFTDNEVPPAGHCFVRGVCSVCGLLNEGMLKGDLTFDGYVTSADAVLLARCLANLAQLDQAQSFAADLNSDGYVTSADAVLLARLLANN